jgi:hypothetical protein
VAVLKHVVTKFSNTNSKKMWKNCGKAEKTLLGITTNRNDKCCVQKSPKGEQTAIPNVKMSIIK